jgi:hypothetical protein
LTSPKKRNRCGSVAYTAVKSKIFLSAFLVHNQEKNKDMRRLIEQFNEMSKQIQQSRQGLSTHNLYLLRT